MAKRDKCRTCGNERKEGVEWYDDDYCSGKCRKADGEAIAPVIEQVKSSGEKATLDEYLLDYPANLGGKDGRGQRIKGRMPKRYCRRFQPERLNWDDLMNEFELEQAGFRDNRVPIPGDFDYSKKKFVLPEDNVSPTQDERPPNQWQVLKLKAKSLGISTHAKTREQLEAKIQEKENE